MQIPSYFLPRPPADLDPTTFAAFDQLFEEAVASGEGAEITYTLAAPKWKFLCYLADQKSVVLHGTGNPSITEFEPRQSNDVEEFGNRRAVYAASDGIWPLYFAIMDREQYPMSLINGCFRLEDAAGNKSEPFYFFSISQNALQYQPWRSGIVYLLPGESFERQAPLRRDDTEIYVAQCASLIPVRPPAKLMVSPNDFPFLAQIRGHDDDVVWERTKADPDGFPWLDES